MFAQTPPITPHMLGITPEAMLQYQYVPDNDRKAYRRALAQKSERDLWDELKYGFSIGATRGAIQRAAPHPVTRALGISIQRVLDTTATNGGSVLPRVDLEDILYALFIKMFPGWERIPNGPSNGLNCGDWTLAA